MKAHDIRALMEIPPAWKSDDGEATFWIAEPFNGGMLWVGRFIGQSPWERHPDGDELLHTLAGETEVTVLTDEGPVTTTVPAGSVFVVQQGLWHRQVARAEVTQMGVTSGSTDHSTADDPRAE